jgi:hypothetical protein
LANPIQAYLTKKSPSDDDRNVTATDVTGDKVALDTFVRGGNVAATFSGLAIAGKVSVTTIDSDQWYPFPSSPLANRNALAIQNISGVDILLNYDPLAISTEGITILNGYERQYDITDSIIIYLRRKIGSGPISVQSEELS